MVILATAAAVIASQAIISGAFSLTMQAIQLGYMPRLKVNYTSERIIGQIYVPVVNWALMLSCIGLVLGFRHLEQSGRGLRRRDHDDDADHDHSVLFRGASALALAGGAQPCRWPRSSSSSISRFSARTCSRSRMAAGSRCSFRASILFLMLTWRKGRRVLRDHLGDICLPLDVFLPDLKSQRIRRVPGHGGFHVGQPLRHAARVAAQSQAQQSAARTGRAADRAAPRKFLISPTSGTASRWRRWRKDSGGCKFISVSWRNRMCRLRSSV